MNPLVRERYIFLKSPWLIGALLASALQLAQWYPAQWLDLAWFDLVAPRIETPSLEHAVLIAIDDASIAALGPWPWSRRVHAAMINRLSDAGVAAIGYDVAFAQPNVADPVADGLLAKAVERSARLVLPVVAAPAGSIAVDSLAPESARQVFPLLPFAELAGAARALGHVDMHADADGRVRRVFLQEGLGAAGWPSLALATLALQRFKGMENLPGERTRNVEPAPKTEWWRDYQVLVPPWPASAGVPQLSFAEVLRTPGLLAPFKNQTVFVGVTATGLTPTIAVRSSMVTLQIPALQFHALSYGALRAGEVITPLDSRICAVLMLPLFALLWLGLPRFDRAWAMRAALTLLVPAVVSAGMLQVGALWFPPLPATLGLIMGYALWRGNVLRQMEQQLFRVQQQAQATLHAIADGVLTVNTAQEVMYANPMAQQMARRGRLEGIAVADLFADQPPHRALVRSALTECMAIKEAVRVPTDLLLESSSKDTRQVRLTATPLIDPRGKLEGAVLAISDVTETAQAYAQLDHEANHDTLTGLPNRILFQDRLRQSIAHATRTGESLAVLYMDLDRFKLINDSLGHQLGDHVLKVVADRLRRHGRKGDTVARWGGDEFVIILTGLAGHAAIAMAAQRITELVGETIEVEGIDLKCKCSVGIAVAPQDSADPDTLLAMADMAMYRGKTETSGHLEFYSAEMSLGRRDRLQLETDLRNALERHEFELHYQPLFDLKTGQAVALEALLRWRTSKEQLLMPNQFISVAEENGMIVPIGDWVIAEVARQISSWQAAGFPAIRVSVNLSPRQCLDYGVVATLRGALADTGIRPGLLMLEMTENTAMRDVGHVIQLMKEISALGVGLALDDFGTGYSSLSALKNLPLDQIKIDQSFVRDISADSTDADMVASIIELAHIRGLPVVAEGVEVESQWAFLAERNCDIGQGYLFARPLPASTLTEFLGWGKKSQLGTI